MEKEQPTTTAATVEGSSAIPLRLPPADVVSEESLLLLQQIYQHRQAEQYHRAQTSLAMQHLTYFHALQAAQQQQQQQLQQQQHQSSQDTKSQGQASSASAADTSEESDTQMSPTAKDCTGLRNRRSYSGSGQTISPLTKERIKTMIESKRNRNRSDSGSASQATTSTAWTSSPSSTANSNTASWSSSIEGPTSQQPRLTHTASVPAPVTVSSPHFEPYYIPSTVHAMHGTLHPSDYQLRKVSSEPNLKMRVKLRAKLLNKASSPLQSQNSAFTFTQRISQSDTPMDTDYGGSTSNVDSPTRLLVAAPHLMIPSPSLPNLASPAQMQMDMSILLAQALCTPFFSMPSLNRSNLLQPAFSMVDSGLDLNNALIEKSARQPMKFDTRTLSSPLPLAYPSLLKQQLHDLMLRRKSLVQEEPEDEAALEAQLFSRLRSGSGSTALRTQLKTGLVYDSAMAKHHCVCGNNENHVEHGERVQSVWSRLQERGLLEKCERVCARKAPLEMLRTVHAATYVTFFAVSPTACLEMEPSQLPVKSFVQLPCGGIGVDSDTYFNDASTQLATRIAVGSLAELALQVAESRLRNGFACIRPPGHHAEYDQAMGFCFFNNVAIAAKYLQQRCIEQCSRIAIIDWDVHHGNGTQLCFESDPSVLYLSLHRHDNGNFFPGTGAVTEVGIGAGEGYTVNVPFSDEMMDDADYLAAWRVIVIPVLNHFKPTFIIVSAGFDAARGHSQALGGYNLSPQLFGYFTRQLMNYADGRVVLAMEGGYDLEAISESAEECVKVLSGDGPEKAGKLSDDALNALPKQSAQEAIRKVVAIHKKHWPSLAAAQGISTSELHWQAVAQQFASLSV